MADLHFGYELSQRNAGRLLPLWGMDSIEQRLLELVADYAPQHLLLVGDLVHDHAAALPARELIGRLADVCDPILIAGNHDRKLAGTMAMVDAWETDAFHFHHGHRPAELSERFQIIGHHHPAGTLTDGAGLQLKLPAFVQQERRWILPAFSPWAAGAAWAAEAQSRVWLCTPQRVFPLPHVKAVAS